MLDLGETQAIAHNIESQRAIVPIAGGMIVSTAAGNLRPAATQVDVGHFQCGSGHCNVGVRAFEMFVICCDVLKIDISVDQWRFERAGHAHGGSERSTHRRLRPVVRQ